MKWHCWLIALVLGFSGFAVAQERDSESRQLRRFIDGVGEFLYFLAWPSATYEGVRFDGIARQPEGADLKLTLYGSSALDGSSLWTEMVLEVRRGRIADLHWGRNNAILFKPGESMAAMGQALVALSKEYARSTGNPTAAAAEAPSIRLATVCIMNPSDRPVAYTMTWAGREDTRTLAPNQSYLYWSGDTTATFFVSFDNSYQAGYTPTRLGLSGTVRDAEPAACSDSAMYSFQSRGDVIGIVPAAWTPGFPHSFVANVVAADRPGNWTCARGYKWIDPNADTIVECVPQSIGLLGVTLATASNAPYPFIQAVRATGPASRAGVPAGSWLMSVGGVSMANRSVDEAVGMLRGTVGVPVVIGVAAPGGGETRFTVVRE